MKMSREELEKELEMFKYAYGVINQEHTMMMKELGLNPNTKPTIEIIRNAISSKVKEASK